MKAVEALAGRPAGQSFAGPGQQSGELAWAARRRAEGRELDACCPLLDNALTQNSSVRSARS